MFKPSVAGTFSIRLVACVSVLAFSCLAFAVRPASISATINLNSPSFSKALSSGAFFRAGGVMPVGDVKFRMDDGTVDGVHVDVASLRLEAERAKGIFITRGSERFNMPMPSEWVCPLLRFVEGGQSIAYTLPPMDLSDADLSEFELVEGGAGYVSRELLPIADFLHRLDLHGNVQALPDNVESAILETANREARNHRNVPDALRPGSGTYVNADFHIRYIAYLAKSKSVDIAGLPLRYTWQIEPPSRLLIQRVSSFRLPVDKDKEAVNQVLFFHNVAILRKFAQAKAAEYNSLVSRTCPR